MTTVEIKRKILEGLEANFSAMEIREILVDYKNEGGTKELTYKALEEMRYTIKDEKQEDKILELMDFVSGFCSSHVAIW